MKKSEKKREYVRVTAAVIERRGKVLIARRRRGDRFGGLWEFPGGKIDADETPKECLKRELGEELGVRVRLGELFCRSRLLQDHGAFELLTFRARLVSGEPEAREHDELRWVKPVELEDFDFPDLDRPVVRRLRVLKTSGASAAPGRAPKKGKGSTHGTS